MYEHHKQSIENLINYFKDDPDVIAVVLGGSVAKGCERADSDIDAIVVVTEKKYREHEKQNRLSECIVGHCPYEHGYFDLKYCTEEYLEALSQRGSEPSRNAFLSSRCLYTKSARVEQLVQEIPVFQKSDQEEKMLSFYSALDLNMGYFWGASRNNPYLRARATADIVLFGLRLLLQENEVLFPCHKALYQTVAKLPNKPADLMEKLDAFLAAPNDDTKNAFVSCVLGALAYKPPEDETKTLSRFVNDNELWWYKNRPFVAEW